MSIVDLRCPIFDSQFLNSSFRFVVSDFQFRFCDFFPRVNGLENDFKFRRVAIVGLGLLGGSFGLALKRAGFPGQVVGHARRAETREQAIRTRAVDEVFSEPTEAVAGADLVILATPVAVILDHLQRLHPHFSSTALVTDVGSTKRRICECAAGIYKNGPMFLGGHPMAGKERSGLEHADALLFENARYVLTPIKPEDFQEARVQAFRSLVTAIGARPLTSHPAAHDLAVAYVSHLPQLLSSGLASLVGEKCASDDLSLEFAASGLRDMTRLADSPYSVWRDICLTNSDNIQTALDAVEQKLESIRLHLRDRELEREFIAARRLRDKLREAR